MHDIVHCIIITQGVHTRCLAWGGGGKSSRASTNVGGSGVTTLDLGVGNPCSPPLYETLLLLCIIITIIIFIIIIMQSERHSGE